MTCHAEPVTAAGYAHPAYAAALAEQGEPLELPRAGGWLLRRPVGDSGRHDAMGCYPLFCCRDWGALAEDLAVHTAGLVTVTVVTEPFGRYTEGQLRAAFPDLCRRYKDHFVTDLQAAPSSFPCPAHARNARRGRGAVSVQVCADPAAELDAWCALYGALVRRHGIGGLQAFSRASFAAQLRVPGLRAVRADLPEGPAAMLLWYVDGEVAYYHLGASSPAGYRARASFALFDASCDLLAAEGVRWLALGAGAGASADGDDGLTRFKRGWSTGTRPVYLCGRILDAAAYGALAPAVAPGGSYFPAYRTGEFR